MQVRGSSEVFQSFLMATRLVMASLSQTVCLAAQAHTSCSPSGHGWAADCVCATGCRRGEPVKKRDGNTHTGHFNTSTSASLAACQRNIVSLLQEGRTVYPVCVCVCVIDINKDGRRVFTSPLVPRCVALVEVKMRWRLKVWCELSSQSSDHVGWWCNSTAPVWQMNRFPGGRHHRHPVRCCT